MMYSDERHEQSVLLKYSGEIISAEEVDAKLQAGLTVIALTYPYTEEPDDIREIFTLPANVSNVSEVAFKLVHLRKALPGVFMLQPGGERVELDMYAVRFPDFSFDSLR